MNQTWRSGMAMFVGSYCDGSAFDNFSVRCPTGANGVVFGDSATKVLGVDGSGKSVGFKFNGHLKGTSVTGNYGVKFDGPISGAEINLHVDGFETGVLFNRYWVMNPPAFAGCRVRIWGPASTVIKAKRSDGVVVTAGDFSSYDDTLVDTAHVEIIPL